LEAARIGAGASGRTGGIALAETAAGDLVGLGDVLAGFAAILEALDVECDLSLGGAWEIGRGDALANSPIEWNDRGTLRVVSEVPGGTIHPGKLVSGLAGAAVRLGVTVIENAHVECVGWGEPIQVELDQGHLEAGKVLLATNALSLNLARLNEGLHPMLTLAAATRPICQEDLAAIGLSEGQPFYTVDLPYLWGRTLRDNSIVWGAGLVQPPESGDLAEVDIDAEDSLGMFASLEERIRGLHPVLSSVEFTHRWGGPILFRDGWQPVFAWHPRSRNAIVLGAYAGHGVALSSFLGAWAAEALLGRRELPAWGEVTP
jgi:glycine/D-amino acid oxidase-like deaminating enzyme